MKFKPLKIKFNLSSPVCLTYPFIHFDAILSHLLARKEMGDKHRARPSKRLGKDTVLVGEKKLMPLKQSSGVYHGSVSFFSKADPKTTTIYKRFSDKHLDVKRVRKKKIHRNSGVFRDYMIKLVYLPCEYVVFYACGDKKKINNLLEGLTGLGKKTAAGFGLIRDFNVNKIKDDYSVVKNNTSSRAIPVVLCENPVDVVNLAWRAPYWAKEMVAPCVPPHTRCKLNEKFYKRNFKTREYLVKNNMQLRMR